MSPSQFLKKQETGQTYWLRGQSGRTNRNNPSSCLRPSYAAGVQITNEKNQSSHINWVGTPADRYRGSWKSEGAAWTSRERRRNGERNVNPFASEMRETPNPKSQPFDVFPAAFARKPLGAPARGRSAASWSSAAGGRWQEEFPARLARRCQPRMRDARRGKPGPSRAPLGSERDGGGGDLAPSLGSLAKRAALAQGRERAGRRPQPATPSLAGDGQRRCSPFQGYACIRVPIPSARRCCALVTHADPEVRRPMVEHVSCSP